MPGCGATFDENSVPPWTRGTLEACERGTNPPRCCAPPPPTEGIFRGLQLMLVLNCCEVQRLEN